jgi:hypothetical protein
VNTIRESLTDHATPGKMTAIPSNTQQRKPSTSPSSCYLRAAKMHQPLQEK